MGTWRLGPLRAAAAISLALAICLTGPAMADCMAPGDADYAVAFPQGDVPIKLYQSDKGGRVGSVLTKAVKDKLELCSEKVGSVNEIRLPKDVAIELDAGKTETSNGRYWVRSNQIRFTSGSAEAKQFACERNQVKTRVAGGAAGAESCK